MDEAEPPECPVCLQPYDDVSAIPRVLSCGHTTCQPCLNQLPRPFPTTIRCTVCTLLMKLPNSPSSLPKNIDLLYFSLALQHRHPVKEKRLVSPPSPLQIGENHPVLFPSSLKLWSSDFYSTWKRWVLPKDCILIEETGVDYDGGVVHGKVSRSFESDHVIGCVMRERECVGLVKVGVFVESQEDSKFFISSYESRIMAALYEMKEVERYRLRIILNATHRVSNVEKAYGCWYNEDDMCVYIVFEKFTSPSLVECVLKKKDDEKEMLSNGEIGDLGMVGMEICEILSCMHFEGLVFGFLSLNCFSFNHFGRVCVDFSEVLSTSRRVNMAMRSACRDLEINLDHVFISPEMLSSLVVKDGIELEPRKSRYEVGYASDVWLITCLLVRVIVGTSFVEEVKPFSHSVINAIRDETDSEFSGLYMTWMNKIAELLESRLGFTSLLKILCRCLEYDPGNRPILTDLWKCLRELVIKPQFDTGLSLKKELKKENSDHYVVLGDVCFMVEETKKELGNGDEVESRVERDVIDGISQGHLKCVEMKSHLDCVTGLAIGGGFLFSSSYDKLVHVWSMHDFTCLHSFKGHEHRITSLVYVDGEQPLCISGDNEGVICIWKVGLPFCDEPLKKLHENKDWRYSGIHAMAISGTEYLYTGSGDKMVKAWSLHDYTISCTMSGHSSVVSSLVVSNGVLYSGSWDGSIRLWSLSDHSQLAVLGQDKVGPVLCLSMDGDLLLAGYENGTINVWHNDGVVKSIRAHKGGVFCISKKGKWVFSGGWDKMIRVHEILEEGVDEREATDLGSIACNSTITNVVYWNEKLFVAQADRIIKVYYGV